MSKLVVAHDIIKNNWSVDESQLDSGPTEIILKVGSNSNVKFKDLSFGFELTQNGNVIAQSENNTNPSQILGSDSYHTEIWYDIELIPTELYVLRINLRHNGKSFEFSHNIVPPKPEKPAPSWIWSDAEKDWVAPIPMPTDGIYRWRESLGKWEKSPATLDAPDTEIS